MSSLTIRTSIALGIGTALMAFCPAAAVADPANRVARLSFVSGTVSFHPAPAANWAAAALNYPMTTGDQLWTADTGRAEVQLGSATVRLAAGTSLDILDLDSRIIQLRLPQGTVVVNIRDMAPDDTVEVDTPNSAISLLLPGTYRIEADATGNASRVTVRRGDADIATAATTLGLDDGAVTVTGLTEPDVARIEPAAPDEWETWSESRDWRRSGTTAQMFVSSDVIGYDDLDDYGTWNTDASDPVWIPHVAADWAPYRVGHWAWVEPWGWTWIDDAPWGFAPFHYGRWTRVGGQWGWTPGNLYARPVYAPALVAFLDGAPAAAPPALIAWFPLGPRDAFEPSYQAGPGYVRAINAPQSAPDAAAQESATAYPNRSVAGAITMVPRAVLVHELAVSAAAVPVPSSTALAGAVPGTAARVAPEAASVLAQDADAAMPPTSALTRLVMARRLPPPPVIPFAARQGELAQQPGRPLDDTALRSLRSAGDATAINPLVRVVAREPDQ